MNEIKKSNRFFEAANVQELDSVEQNLVQQARSCVEDAYAPYSRFQVGAAVLLEDGTVVTGNNQENASYPIGMCAERVALFAASAHYPRIRVKAIAITARSASFIIDKPVTPCGACRQAIAEYEHRHGSPIRIIMTGESGPLLIAESISPLLPFQFTADDLQKK